MNVKNIIKFSQSEFHINDDCLLNQKAYNSAFHFRAQNISFDFEDSQETCKQLEIGREMFSLKYVVGKEMAKFRLKMGDFENESLLVNKFVGL